MANKMQFTTLRRTVFILLVLSHFGVFFLLFAFYSRGGFTFAEFTTTVAIVLPLFASYTTAVVKDVINSAKRDLPGAPTNLSWEFAFLTIVFVAAFSIYIIVVISLKAWNKVFGSFDDFKIVLALSESVFGVYVALVLPVLFARSSAETEYRGSPKEHEADKSGRQLPRSDTLA